MKYWCRANIPKKSQNIKILTFFLPWKVILTKGPGKPINGLKFYFILVIIVTIYMLNMFVLIRSIYLYLFSSESKMHYFINVHHKHIKKYCPSRLPSSPIIRLSDSYSRNIQINKLLPGIHRIKNHIYVFLIEFIDSIYPAGAVMDINKTIQCKFE